MDEWNLKNGSKLQGGMRSAMCSGLNGKIGLLREIIAKRLKERMETEDFELIVVTLGLLSRSLELTES